MIVMGYPGIGKSSICSKHNNYIDFEAAHFYVGDTRMSGWESVYVSLLNYLSSKDLVVFCTLRWEIVRLLENSAERKILIYPSVELKEEWLARLVKRRDDCPKRGNESAVRKCLASYEADITRMRDVKYFEHAEITTPSFDLQDIMENILTRHL